MKKMTIIGCLLIMATTAFAQPGWVKNASKSVFTLKTFSADGSLIASTNGFFTGTNGEAVSSFSPFKGASKAVIIDSQGKEFQVTGILGANDMYDVVKFRVNNSKCQPLTVSSVKGSVGSQAWLLPYHETKELRASSIKRAETIFDDYAYYTVSMSIADNMVSCPLMNESGDVLGMMQQPATDKDTLSYAISARFVNDLKITGLTYNDATLQLTQIKKELPTDLKEANLVLYLAASQMDSLSYINLIEDFIRQFPGEPDGYTARAIQAVNGGKFTAAEKDMEQAINVSSKKDDAHYSYARMIYNKEIYQSAQPYAGWNLDKALSEIQTANSINSQPTYRQLEANILYAQKKYDEAYQIFNELTNTSLRNAEVFYSAAKCKEMLKDTTSMLALLDSTLNMFSKPYLKEAAPYLWARAEARSNAGKYRDAISDMNEYEELMQATVNDNFYYVRHQTDIKGRLYQQALNDINRAIQMNPQETLYYAEKASLEIRVGKYDDAILTAQDCINLDASNSDGYLFLGLAQCLKGQKAEGIKNLQKAKELGDTQADALIEKYK
jgi:predicted Zn-dependent protease